MKIDEIEVEGYERVIRATQERTPFHALIAIHSTHLGPALGGLRMWKYRDDAAALTDVLRLARGMTYKSAVARTGFGGGKAVVIADSRHDKTDELFQFIGRFIDSLAGEYITAEDVGIDVHDLDMIARETRHVTGRSREVGGSGDPSPYTALGTFLSVGCSLRHAVGSPDVSGRRVMIQGLGHVGYWLAKHLHEAGARLLVSDLESNRVERVVKDFGAEVVRPEHVFSTPCDVFAPCALGAILNDETIPQLRCKVVCGAANNQLQEPRHGRQLMQRGILYAPDYVVNAGGILNISVEVFADTYREDLAIDKVKTIVNSLDEVFEHAREEGISPAMAADQVAERVLAEAQSRPHSA